MVNIFLFICGILAVCSLTFFINLRMWQAFKKGVDITSAFKKCDISAARKLELEDSYNQIINRG